MSEPDWESRFFETRTEIRVRTRTVADVEMSGKVLEIDIRQISYMVTTRLAIDRVGMISNATKKTEAPNEALFCIS